MDKPLFTHFANPGILGKCLDVYACFSGYQPRNPKASAYYKCAENQLKLAFLTGKNVICAIEYKDRIVAIKELHKEFNKQITQSISTGNVVNVKTSLCDLVEETLNEPRSGTLKALPETVDSLITGYSQHPEILKSIASISFKDYTTIIHSVNVMALTLGFCFYSNYKIQKIQQLGLSALLHDVGKTEIPATYLKNSATV